MAGDEEIAETRKMQHETTVIDEHFHDENFQEKLKIMAADFRKNRLKFSEAKKSKTTAAAG